MTKKTCLICKYFCCVDGELNNDTKSNVLVCCCDKNEAYLTYLHDLKACEDFEKVF